MTAGTLRGLIISG